MRRIFNVGKIVIKVGTNILTQGKNRIDIKFIHNLSSQISLLHSQNKNIIIVTSGAIKCGTSEIGDFVNSLSDKQAAAAIGQGILMQYYIRAFKRFNIKTAQVLLTRDDIADRKRYLNAKNTFSSLFKYKAIPIVNENDTVATEEIKEMRFGDNDTLSALVASLVNADLLIILSDVQGFYNCDPKKNINAKLISEIDEITDDIIHYAGGAGYKYSIGGMKTKLSAAKISTYAGIPLVIASGFRKNVIQDIIAGKDVGTLFLPKKKILSSKKCWIGFCIEPEGKLTVQGGAKEMLKKNKSLLPVGITGIEGKFDRGSVVSILDENKKEFARGIVNYSSEEINKIQSRSSKEILNILGYYKGDEVVHCDNLAIIE